MYSLSECLDFLRWNTRWIFLQKVFTGTACFRKKLHLRCSTEFEYHSGDSKPLLTFSKNQTADLLANKAPIGTFSK